MIILAFILLLLGPVMFFKTDWFWRLTESWKSERASGPSELYDINIKFGFPRRFGRRCHGAVFLIRNNTG